MHDPATNHEFNNLPITPAPPPGFVVADLFGASYGYHVRRPQGTRDWLLTFTLETEVRFATPGEVHDFTDALAGAVAAVVASFDSPGGRPYRLVAAGHPAARSNQEAADVRTDR